MARQLRILVVEDNRHVAELIQQGLTGSTCRDFGGRVSFALRNAEGGRAAIAMLRDEQFDALIIEVYLPVVGRPTVIEFARKELGLADLPNTRRSTSKRCIAASRCAACSEICSSS